MDVLVVAATSMDAKQTLAPAAPPHSPVATTIATMEAASPAEAKPKAAKKMLSKEEKIVEAAKRRGRRKNLKEKTAAAANQQAWQMQMKADVAQVALHLSLAEAYMLVKREGIAGVAPPASSVLPLPCRSPRVAVRLGRGVAPVQYNIFFFELVCTENASSTGASPR
ncbi:hypothetical protein QYE76_044720 [Lolium multiflorum]|uniref:Uncharacterized protein n=1 Tax=Lolium multiflorum TaxID=4521 RepID=A0AAD8TLH8_LOLMU|nr:hypothetical protein QYE76_044720 [Lolium multiflorum]